MQDTTPPQTSFNAPQPASDASQVALLSWQAQDASAVTYQCRLNASSTARMQQPVRALSPAGDAPGPPLALGQWLPCSPPLQLYWLSPGAPLCRTRPHMRAQAARSMPPVAWRGSHNRTMHQAVRPRQRCPCGGVHRGKGCPQGLTTAHHAGQWSLEVQSTDAASNQSPTNLVSSWANKLRAGISYPRILAGPFGPVANKGASFFLQVGAASSRDSSGGLMNALHAVLCACCVHLP